MKLITGISIVLVSLSVVAEPLVSLDQSHNKLKTLQDYFQAGEAVSVADVVGWRSGRCFAPSEPNVALAALLIAEYKKSGQLPDTDGPLFPEPVPTLEFVIGVAGALPSEATSYYDELTPFIEAFVNSSVEVTPGSNVNSENGSLVAKDEGSYMSLAIRKYAGYYFTQARQLKDNGDFKKGDLRKVCYFFKRIK